MTFIPAQCSERESGGYEDCTWASGVMLNNAAHAKNVRPSTRAEYEALRVAGGDGPAENPGDGSNIGQLVTGIKRRYGWEAARIGPPGAAHPSFEVLWAKLQPGYGAVVQGWMGVWVRTSHWRRWDPNFGGAHAVFAERVDTSARVWWMNPLAPNSYDGEWMDKSDLKKYWDGMFGGATWVRVGELAPPTEDAMDAFSAPQQPSTATAKKATKLWANSKRTGPSYDVPAGHVKRFTGGPSSSTDGMLVIVHDRDTTVTGKSNLFGIPDDWEVKVIP